MKCYYHNDRDAVSQCGVCGKGLCKECTDKYDEPLCEKCGDEIVAETQEELKDALTRSKKSAKNWIILSFFAMFFIGVVVMSSVSDAPGIGFVIGAYLGLAMAMGLEKSLNSKAAGLLAVPILGWVIFLYAIALLGVIFAIPEFIKQFRIVKEAGGAAKKL